MSDQNPTPPQPTPERDGEQAASQSTSQAGGNNHSTTGADLAAELAAGLHATTEQSTLPGELPAVSIESLQAELMATKEEAKDTFLRAKADVENARRRAEEDVQKSRKFAVESFAESLLPIIDSFDAALATSNATIEQMREGIVATQQQLSSALERNKVTSIAPEAGTKFDPHHHQAISVVSAEQEANTVVMVLQKGYLIADRVMRPALVTVTAPK